MKNRLLSFTLFAVMFFSGFSVAFSQAIDFARLDNLFGNDPKIEVTLRGSLLRMAATMAEHDDEEVGKLLRGMKGIYVRGYDLNGNRERTNNLMRDYSRELGRKGWETMARTRDDGESVYVMVMGGEEVFEGMLVMVMDESENEVIFVNILGTIDPSQLSRLGRTLKIDAMDGIDVGSRSRSGRNDE